MSVERRVRYHAGATRPSGGGLQPVVESSRSEVQSRCATVYTCRECEREINQGAEVCPYCGADLTPAPEDPAQPQKKTPLYKTVLRYAVLLAAMWGFLWYVLPERRGQEAAAIAELRAVEALRRTRDVLAAYAAAQGGVFPKQLESLPGESFAQVREAAQTAQREGYRLEYAAAESADGEPRHFVLLARPGNYSYRNFFLDETGVIRGTKENRPATAQDTPI